MITLLLAALGVQAPPPEVDTTKRTTAFAFALYPHLLGMSKDRNLFVSPLSISLALSMAHVGAEGATREAMAKVLGWEGLEAKDVDLRCAALLAALRPADPAVKLQIANSAWTHRDIPFHAAYVERLRDRYGATAEAIPFDAAGAERIDGWVKENTAGKIERIAPDPIPADAALFLLNAVYFKAPWQYAFDPKLTRERPFHLASGAEKKLPFMSRTARFGHFETAGLRAIRIPYGAGDRLALYVFVPAGTATLADFHRRLGAEAWEGWMGQFKTREICLDLPRFKLAGELPLNGPLCALGMSTAFRDGADFSGMSPAGRKFHINEVLQKTFLDVNEEGSVAAAVTSVRLVATSAPPPPKPFPVDRPFFLAIRDDRTGALLFMGSILDP